MDVPRFHQLSTGSKVSIFAVLFILAGLFVTVNLSVQEQDNRSKASSNTNFILNPSCEGSTAGFVGYQAKISTSTDSPHSGSTSCLIKYSTGSFYDMEAIKGPANPVQGQQYSGSAYVRSTTAVGKPVYIALREEGGNNSHRTTYGAPVYLTPEWQLVTNTMTVKNSGRTRVKYYVVQEKAQSGQSFYADDMTFTLGNGSLPSVAPTCIEIRIFSLFVGL